MDKRYLYLGIIGALAAAAVLMLTYSQQPPGPGPIRPTTLIFQLKSDYSGNYLGPIGHYTDSDGREWYQSSYTMALFDYCETKMSNDCVKKLQNGYYATSYPNSESMVERFAVLDKSIDTKSHALGAPGNSIRMPRGEFYGYVIDESPLLEAFFCDEPAKSPDATPRGLAEENVDAVATGLANGEIPETCKRVV